MFRHTLANDLYLRYEEEDLIQLGLHCLRDLCEQRFLLTDCANPHAATCVKLLLRWKSKRTAAPLPHSLEGVPEEALSALDIQELRELCLDRGLLKWDAQTSSVAKIHKGIFSLHVHWYNLGTLLHLTF